MPDSRPRILVVGNPGQVRLAEQLLAADSELLLASDAGQAQKFAAESEEISVLLADAELFGAAAMAEFAASHPTIGRILLAKPALRDRALQAVRAGEALCFVDDPPGRDSLLQSVHVAAEWHRMNEKIATLDDRLDRLDKALRIGAEKPRMRQDPQVFPTEAELSSLRNDAMMVVSHDLRSPLAVIQGYSEVLLQSESAMSDAGKRMIERMRRSCVLLLELVDRVLDLSAIESGFLPLEYEAVHLTDLIGTALETLQGMAEERRVEVTVEVTGDDATVLLDRIRVVQVLQNLFSNAVKYSEPGGLIAIRGQCSPERIVVSMSDSGPGMSKEQQTRIFERFSRFSAEPERGNGLGLAIAKSIVEMHGGEIWVEGEPGAGTTMHFTLRPGPA